MEDENKVLPCSFCGSKDIVTDHMTQAHPIKSYDVYCAHCGCGTMSFSKPEKAVKSWNSRVKDN